MTRPLSFCLASQPLSMLTPKKDRSVHVPSVLLLMSSLTKLWERAPHIYNPWRTFTSRIVISPKSEIHVDPRIPILCSDHLN